ncbi:aspartyl/asparaginyl beta-hydroxylase isoform X2 [Microcaecilia unicolor]|uniref:Aspartyl/asparaginyl beta-hydroxylase isoform X2 n=1 Tax=Microcaecilia unicolor TaxID=1415580 RepID=A0A6P7Z0I5_9AMPH|nr:aspartyl/asparaginyl beta-hydroxylase isoform X2 [Microcaecilia unicolor]
MAPKNSKANRTGQRKDTSQGGSKNGKKGGLSGSSFFTWFMVIALLGVWTSVAVVWFDLVDYEQVLAKAKDFRYNFSEVLQGKLGIYDADGDGDFDVEDAKVLLGLKEQSGPEGESEDPIHPEVEPPLESDYENAEDEVEEIIEPHVHRTIESQPVEEEQDEDEEQTEDDRDVEKESDVYEEWNDQQQEDDNEGHEEIPTLDDYHAEQEAEEPELYETPEQDEEDTEDDHHHTEAAEEEEPEPYDSPVSYEAEAEKEERFYEPEAPAEAEPGEVDEEVTKHERLEPEQDEETEAQQMMYEQPQTTDEANYAEPHPEHVYDDADRAHDTVYHSENPSVETAHDTVYHSENPPVETEQNVHHPEGHREEPSGKNEETTMDQKEKAKKKKPKLLNKFDKTIKDELDAAEKLRKKGKTEEAVKAFEELVNKYPQSPRARYGKAQSEDDLAEKLRSNEALLKAIGTYEEVASLPNAPSDLIKLTLKRRAERQQFLGRMRGSVVTLQRLVELFPDDISLRNVLGVGYLLLGDNSNAKKVYEEVLSLASNDGFAKVHYGFILKAENKIAESIPYLKEGLESGDPGTDDGRFYFHLGDAMQRVGNKEAYKWYELGHQRGHFASVWQRSLYNVNGLKAQPWWTAKETGYSDLVKSLERHWKLIRDEGLAVMDKAKGLFIPEDENLREKGDWSQYTLWQQGKKNENACSAAPGTCGLLERFPESTGCRRGQIKYSVMHPGTHVWPHTGPTNCRLRMHLGLVVPKKGCQIRCANETRSWDEGKVLIFDDSFEHEVWQDADSYRLIFIVDVWHPELTVHQRRTLPAI